MYQVCPEFALEFAQIPELNDGVHTRAEVGAVWNVSKALHSVVSRAGGVPRGFFEAKPSNLNVKEIYMEWRGDGVERAEWRVRLGYSVRKIGPLVPWDAYYRGRVVGFETVGFENGEDVASFVDGVLAVKSFTGGDDVDGIKVSVELTRVGNMSFSVNNNLKFVYYADLLDKDDVLSADKYGFKGVFAVKRSYEGGLASDLNAMKDMVLAGEGDHRFSAAMQALLWGYLDGSFGVGDNPFGDYRSVVHFVKPIWGDMKGERWDEFGEVTSRLSLPELVDYYERKNFSYEYYRGPLRSVQQVFKDKRANCYDTTEFTVWCLRKGGYRAGSMVIQGAFEGHNVTYYKDKGKWFVMDNGGRWHAGIKGPFDSLKDSPYRILDFVH